MKRKIGFMSVVLILALLTPVSVFANGADDAAAETDMAAGEIEYPTKAINFLIPFGVGGSADLMGRALAGAAEKGLGEPVVPVNKPGAGGGIMYTELAGSSSDGYTVGWNSTSLLTTTNMGNIPYSYDDFDNLCNIGYTSMPIAVKADAPWQTVDELVDWAKANPGKLRIGNAGAGSGTHLTAVMFSTAADISVTHVPLGAKRRVPSLLGDEVEAICVPLPEVAPQAMSGNARILAVSITERDPAFPDVPTFVERGFDVDMALFRGISMPKGVDPEIISVLEDAFRTASESDEFKQIASANGFNVKFMNSREYAEYLADQDNRVASAIAAGGLK